jgi:hypothetical protein
LDHCELAPFPKSQQEVGDLRTLQLRSHQQGLEYMFQYAPEDCREMPAATIGEVARGVQQPVDSLVGA